MKKVFYCLVIFALTSSFCVFAKPIANFDSIKIEIKSKNFDYQTIDGKFLKFDKQINQAFVDFRDNIFLIDVYLQDDFVDSFKIKVPMFWGTIFDTNTFGDYRCANSAGIHIGQDHLSNVLYCIAKDEKTASTFKERRACILPDSTLGVSEYRCRKVHPVYIISASVMENMPVIDYVLKASFVDYSDYTNECRQVSECRGL